MLAALLAYLAAERGDIPRPVLQELRDLADFVRWVKKRQQMTLGTAWSPEALALIATTLPLGPSVRDQFNELESGVFDRLIEDRWVELREEPDEARLYAALHDVLADRVVLSFLERHRRTVSEQIGKLIDRGAGIGALPEALLSFQPIAGSPLLTGLSWYELLTADADQSPAPFRDLRSMLVSTSLLAPSEKLDSPRSTRSPPRDRPSPCAPHRRWRGVSAPRW
jgi:hypothetical protein